MAGSLVCSLERMEGIRWRALLKVAMAITARGAMVPSVAEATEGTAGACWLRRTEPRLGGAATQVTNGCMAVTVRKRIYGFGLVCMR